MRHRHIVFSALVAALACLMLGCGPKVSDVEKTTPPPAYKGEAFKGGMTSGGAPAPMPGPGRQATPAKQGTK